MLPLPLFLTTLGLRVASAGVDPWVDLSGQVGAGLGGVGRGGGGTLRVGLDLPVRPVSLAPVLSGFAVGHQNGGFLVDETLDATVRHFARTRGTGVELGVAGRWGPGPVAVEGAVSAGVAQTTWMVGGTLDDAELPGEGAHDSGLSLSAVAGGVTGVGELPIDFVFQLSWRRLPVAGRAVHLLGPSLGLRWGP